MPRSITDDAVLNAIAGAQRAARRKATKSVMVDRETRTIPNPFPSPTDWRNCWIYFLMIDRFNNPKAQPNSAWNHRCDYRQGGTFNGVRAQLGYLDKLGVKAIWLTPVLKNSRPDSWMWNYHGYGAQDFLNLDARFASDGTLTTAEREFGELVDEAHARGIYVILDIVLNHSSRVFDYVIGSRPVHDIGFQERELSIQWLNGLGFPRSDWENRLPPSDQLHPDDAVWPADLQNHLFFRRLGCKPGDAPDWRGFVPGDFGTMRQLVAEYDASVPGQEEIRARYGVWPVLNILVRSYAYLMARYDLDGYRIDTVKYVHPAIIENFGNAMREYAMSIGKTNFFTFGEVADNEDRIADFIGRNTGRAGESFGVDAALDFPLFNILPGMAKGMVDVRELQATFQHRKDHEQQLLTSHGEAGRYFVSFLDNHDQNERFKHPLTPEDQVKLGLTLLFTLQGIPCIYYGTEQLLQGTVKDNGEWDLGCLESVREALWGKPNAFSNTTSMFRQIQHLAQLRETEPALRYGRLYFRQLSGNGTDFGFSYGRGGIVAYSRILGDREVLIAANTGETEFNGKILVDRDLNAATARMDPAYPPEKAKETLPVTVIEARIDGVPVTIATVSVTLKPHEAQVWGTPAGAMAAEPRRARVAA